MSATIEQADQNVAVDVRSAPGTPTWEVARFFPRQGQWTESEYLALETNHFVELKDGCLEFPPMPSLQHQKISIYLMNLIQDFLAEIKSEGKVYYSPLPVRLGPKHIREPDLLIARKQHENPKEPRMLHGADFVLEIVSPGFENRKRDTQEKLHDYATAGIPEYWIVDPEQSRIHVHTLPENTSEYVLLGTFGAGDTAVSKLLDGFNVDVTKVFAAAEAASS